MTKLFLFFTTICILNFDTSEQATFECNFKDDSWVILGKIYNCYITKSTVINSLDESYVDSVTGVHVSGYSNGNIKGLWITVGTTPYFPRGWEKIFQNLIGIHNCGTQLKEIHQSDLKPFPKIKVLYFHTNHIEILEEGLFDYNLELEYLYLGENKITHIDSIVFDKLSKLKRFYLQSNLCINLSSDTSSVQSIIAASKTQCTNSDYSNLDQKFKKLLQESKSLDSKKFNDKIENLEKELKTSKFPNFFQTKLQDLKTIQKSTPETTTITPITETCSGLKSKFISISSNLKNWMEEVSSTAGNDTQNCENEKANSSIEYCLMNNESLSSIQQTVGEMQNSYSKQKEVLLKIDEQVLNIENKISELNENQMKFKKTVNDFNTKLQDLEETMIEKIELEVKTAQVSIIRATNKIEKKIMEKLDKLLNVKKTDNDYENFS